MSALTGSVVRAEIRPGRGLGGPFLNKHTNTVSSQNDAIMIPR